MKLRAICDLKSLASVIDHRNQCRFDGAYCAPACVATPSWSKDARCMDRWE